MSQVMTPMQTIETYLQQAENHKVIGQWEQALSCYQQVVGLQPDHLQGVSGIGDALLNLGQWEQAAEAYRRSLELNPYVDWTYHNLAVALFRLNRWQEGMTYCQKLTELKPEFWMLNQQDFQVQRQYGDFLFIQQRLEEAIAAYQRAITLNPALIGVWINLGKILQQLNRLSEAMSCLRYAITLDAGCIEAHFLLSEVLIEQEDWYGAVTVCRQLLELQPASAEIHQKLGFLLLQINKWPEAVKVLRQGIELNPTSAWMHYYLAEALLAVERTGAAAKNYRQALALEASLAGTNPKLDALLQDANLAQNPDWSSEHLNVTDLHDTDFDWKFYVGYHDDLKGLATYEAAYEHWTQVGRAENRCSSEEEFFQRLGFKPTDVPNDFDARVYLDLNPDLKPFAAGNRYKAIEHFLLYGRFEGRVHSPSALKQRNASRSRVNQGTSTLQPIYEKLAVALRQNLSHQVLYPIPPVDLIQSSGSTDVAHYRNNMSFYTADIVQQCLLQRNSRVLDVGCGVGRIAQGLQSYLDLTGAYVGVDVNREAIQWCQKYLSARNANFEFRQLQAINNYYYEEDNQKPNIYDFSVLGDRTFDCVVALSVFNHLRMEDTVQYLREISKRLDRNGVAYLTFFVIDEAFFKFRQKTGLHRGITQSEGGIWYAYQKQHFFAGYELPRLWSIFEKAGLIVLASSPGSWAEKANARIYQDWFLVTSSRSFS